MVLITKGFESVSELRRHFKLHGDDFRVGTADEYERMADLFLGSRKPEGVHECVRKNGSTLRYDPESDAFGVLDTQMIVRTCFKPVPCSLLAGLVRDAARSAGRCHGYGSNFAYFKVECNR